MKRSKHERRDPSYTQDLSELCWKQRSKYWKAGYLANKRGSDEDENPHDPQHAGRESEKGTPAREWREGWYFFNWNVESQWLDSDGPHEAEDMPLLEGM